VGFNTLPFKGGRGNVIGATLAAIALLMFKGSFERFRYETLLR